MAYCYPRRLRLTKTDEYSSVFSFRLCKSDDLFQVFGRPNGLDRARLGVVVAKRVEKRAVRRNYIKRLARETYRHHAADLAGLDLIVRAKRSFGRADGAAGQRSLRSLFSRLQKWHASSSSSSSSTATGSAR